MQQYAASCDTITLMSYNVENLFDLKQNGSEYEEYIPGTSNWTHTTFTRKIENIASVIAEISPDIVLLSEIENRSALNSLGKALQKKGYPYAHSAIADTPNHTATCPAILSRLPVVSHCSFGTIKVDGYFSRNILEADIAWADDTLKVFGNHWPSKRHAESSRIAAAQIIARRIQDLPPDCDYIIAGDLNENFNEPESFLYTDHNDTRGKTALHHILTAAESAPGSAADYITEKELISRKKQNVHYDLWFELPGKQRISNAYRGVPQTPDHIVLPASLYDTSGISYCDNSFSVFTWNGRLLKDGVPFRWQKQYRNGGAIHVGAGYSDHLPILAKFHTGPFSFENVSDTGNAAHDSTTSGNVSTMGFETGSEGWTRCSRDIVLTRSAREASTGTWSLGLSGFPAKKNVCAARCVIFLPERLQDSPRNLILDILGSGKLNIRIRTMDSKWRYYNYENFQPAGSGRYTLYTFDTWTTITCPLSSSMLQSSSVEVELRAGKERNFSFYIDNIRIGARV
ncbi:MAG: hypothetical protein GF350_09065 [Chitinivibrionales bacterium]|nr:hypothetical protein [Chitinivibrionales bacterium]